jgi:stringent starvation protein B
MGQGSRLPAKKDVVLALLEADDVYIHLDPRRDEVRVPKWFKQQPHLVLQIGLNMPVPITDLEVSDDSVSCTLSFNRSPFFCLIPWRAVYALVGADGRAMVWPDDIPPEVAAQAAKAARQQAPEKEKRGGHLRAVSEDSEAEPAPEEAAPKDAAPEVEAPVEAKLAVVKEAEPEPVPEPEAKAEPEQEAVEEAAPVEKGKRALPPYLRIVK